MLRVAWNKKSVLSFQEDNIYMIWRLSKIASIIPVKMKSESNFKFPPSVKLEKLSLKKSNSENKPGKKHIRMLKDKVRRFDGSWRDDSGVKEPLLFKRTWVWVPVHSWYLTTVRTSSSRGSDALSRPLQASGMQVVHIHTCRQNISTHKIKLNLKNSKFRLSYTISKKVDEHKMKI